MWICRLAEILNQLLVHVYNPLIRDPKPQLAECIQAQRRNLRVWWQDLPEMLRLTPTQLPKFSPPSHIVTLKYLFYKDCIWYGR
jgi:hypothetical protein